MTLCIFKGKRANVANPFLEKKHFFENIEHDLDLPYLSSTYFTDFNFDESFSKKPLSIDDLNFDLSKELENNFRLTKSIDTDYLADENNFNNFDDFFKYTKDLVTQNNEELFSVRNNTKEESKDKINIKGNKKNISIKSYIRSNKDKQQNYSSDIFYNNVDKDILGFIKTNTHLNQDVLKPITAVTKHSINLLYLDEFQHILKMIPQTTEFKVEENSFGKLELRITVWLTANDICTNSFYDIVYGHLMEKRIENGNIFSCIKSISKIKIFISKRFSLENNHTLI